MQNPQGNEFNEQDTTRYVRAWEEMQRTRNVSYLDLSVVDAVFSYYLERSQNEAAHALIEAARSMHPHSGDLRFKESLLCFTEGDLDGALEAINDATSLEPQQLEYTFLRSQILAGMQHFEEAIDLLTDLLHRRESQEETLLCLGDVCQQANRLTEAEQYYREALALAPDFEPALFELAHLLDFTGKQDDAVALYQQYLDDNPFSLMGWFTLGLLHAKNDRINEAIEAFDYAIAVQDDFAEAYQQKAALLMEASRFEEALRELLHSNDLMPSHPDTLYGMGECYEALDSFKDALRSYRKAVDLDPDFTDAYVGMGSCLEHMNQLSLAITHYTKALELDPYNADTPLAIAKCEYKLGNPYSAHERLLEALSIAPKDLNIWREWAEMLYEEGNIHGAVMHLEEGIRQNPVAAELYYLCAAYAWMDKDEATFYLYAENALLMDPEGYLTLFEAEPELQAQPAVVAFVSKFLK